MHETAGVDRSPSCPTQTFFTPFAAAILMIICSVGSLKNIIRQVIKDRVEMLETSNHTEKKS